MLGTYSIMLKVIFYKGQIVSKMNENNITKYFET